LAGFLKARHFVQVAMQKEDEAATKRPESALISA